MEFDDVYALLLTHETILEQEQENKSVFNAKYAYANAFYAQHRGNFKREGYVARNFGSRSIFFGIEGINHLQRMFNRGFINGYGRGFGDFGGGFGQNLNGFNSSQALRNPSYFAKSGFANLNGLQGTFNNMEEMIYMLDWFQI